MTNSLRLFGMILFIALQIGPLCPPVAAAPRPKSRASTTSKPKRIIFTPPFYDAKTIQYTQVMYEAKPSMHQGGAAFGPLQKIGAVTIHLQLPKNQVSGDWLIRLDWTEKTFPQIADYYIEAGGKSAYFADGKFHQFPASGAWWYTPFQELTVRINDHREAFWRQAVATVPAVREGKIVLLSVDTSGNDPRDKTGLVPKMYDEDWYDPKTHLMLRQTIFAVWHGKTQQVFRDDYTGWVLNAPMPAALFAIAPGAVQVPKALPVPATPALFKTVVGITPPPSVIITNAAHTSSEAEPSDWLSFTISQSDLQKIIAKGHYDLSYPGLGGSNPTPLEVANRHKAIANLVETLPPSWWTPSFVPDRYLVYSRRWVNPDNDDDELFYDIVVTPGSDTVYAVYAKPL